MKRILFIAILLGLLFPVVSSARNQIIYRPFNWQKIEKDNFTLYYPKQMEWIIPSTAALIDSLNKVYSSQIFVEYKDYLGYYKKYFEEMKKKKKTQTQSFSSFRDFNQDYKERKQAEEFDTLPTPTDSIKNNLEIISSWRPKKLIIIVYPSFQDFKQEKVIDAILPPGLLGFMEVFGYRVCVPYSGDWYAYATTLAHEIGHAWHYHFLKECETLKKKILRNTNIEEKRYFIPLWAIEGWAQYCSYTFQGNKYEYLRCLLEELTRRDVTSMTNSMKLLDEMEFEVYYNGANFICWMVERFGSAKFIELWQQTVYYANFNKAWQAIFKEKVEESEQLWWEYLMRKYYITIYADTISPIDTLIIKKAPTPGLFTGYVDYDKGRWIYYTKDDKWGTRVVITDIKSKTTIKVHRQFQKKSLWYREDNRPTIKDNLAAFVNNREGQDELIVYRLSDPGKKFKVKRLATLRHKEILSIDNPRFMGDSRIIFEGISLNGESDLYTLNFVSGKLTRLTNDFYTDKWPTLFDRKILFLSDRFSLNSRGLYQFNLETKEITEIYAQENNYVDQICASDSLGLVAFRLVTLEHSPRVYLWSPKEEKIYQIYSQFKGIRQIVAFESDSLIVVASDGVVRKIALDKLTEIQKTSLCQPKTIPSYTWYLPIPDYSLVEYQTKADRRLRYGMVDGDWFYFSDATGERRMSFNFQGGYQAGSLFLYDVWVYYLNLSNRIHKFYNFESYHYYFWRYNPKYCVSNGIYSNDIVTRDWATTLRLQAYYPINLESGIGASIIPGYLRRIYTLYNMTTGQWNWEVDRFSSPTLDGSLFFIKDAVFWGDWGQRNGSYLFTGIYTKFGKVGGWKDIKAIEGYAVFDSRYYLQFGGSRTYWANRFFALKAIGFDQYIYQIEGLYRGSVGYDSISGIRKNLGTNVILFQSELRFPLFNYIAFQPAIIPRSSRSAIAFGIDGSLFWYGGDIWLDGIDRMYWINRAGAAIKIKLNYIISFKIENYKYIYSKKDLNMSNRKWGFALEYDF